jgi:twinkle protein
MFPINIAAIEEAIEFIDDHFDFVNATEDDLTLESILSACLELKKTKRIDALVIDPWNEIEQAIKPAGMNDSEFTGTCLRRLRKFGRKNKVCMFIVVHPTKMYKEKGKDNYPIPTLYDISGSSNWYNKADNGIVVYRNFDDMEDTTDVYVKKVKFRNYGKLGVVKMQYDVVSGNYKEIERRADEAREY